MSNRKRRKRKEWTAPAASHTATVPPPASKSGPAVWYRDRWVWLVSVGVVGVAAFITYKFFLTPEAGDKPTQHAKNGPPLIHNMGEEFPRAEPNEFPGRKSTAKPPTKSDTDDFLGEFGKDDGDSDKENGAGISNRELERQFETLAEINGRLTDLKTRGATPGAFANDAETQRALAECQRLADQIGVQSGVLEKAVAIRPRRARPQDPVPRWLTGELLILIGGEPEEIAPHLEFAAAHGLRRPRLAGSLARVQLRANRFADSYRTAAAALDQNGQDRYLWDAFARAAFCGNQFASVLERLPGDFPKGLPDWAKKYRREAEGLQAKWEIEQRMRRAEANADDLPRVRFTIEHRRFARDAAGNPLTTIESTGRGEIVLELFENEAPLTVANFIDLVTRRFYDGTSFHLALPPDTAAGGDPNTKNDDPDDDGLGGPGYVISDEFRAKNARHHFRGSISMVNTMPHTAGSQFFLSLAPVPKKDGFFTVFGRIIEGQEVADRITRGRTTRKLGHFGRIIPGDLLVRAEVVCKRPHEYRAVKEQP